eukprot:6183683-Pleurochrysis_carterae.AAC.4
MRGLGEASLRSCAVKATRRFPHFAPLKTRLLGPAGPKDHARKTTVRWKLFSQRSHAAVRRPFAECPAMVSVAFLSKCLRGQP